MKKPQITLAKTAGFCFGVDRAVKLVNDLVDSGKKVCTLGPIIHNRHAVAHFAEMGVQVIDTPDKAQPGQTVIIRSHGVTRSVVERLENGGEGLNLCHEVRQGILCHTGPKKAETLEGQVVRLADKIAYINHDIDDAMRGGIIYPMEYRSLSFGGAGTITLSAARLAKYAIGVEIVPPAIADAKKNAQRNGLAYKSRFICADAAKEIPKLISAGERFDAAILDPPRKGADEKLLRSLVEGSK